MSKTILSGKIALPTFLWCSFHCFIN